MSLVDNALARAIAQTPLPVSWRAEHMTARDPEDVVVMELAVFKFPRSRSNFEDSFKSGHLAIVLRDGGNEVAGYLILMSVVDKMHLLNVTAMPAWQRQGLGYWLLCLARVPTLAHGSDSLLLEVRPSNVGAVVPYHRSGFAETGRRKRYHPAENNVCEDALVMRMVCEVSGVETA